MAWCPQCKTEYRADVAECADCQVPLVMALPPESHPDPSEMVPVYDASDHETAEIVLATLQSAGIPAVLHRAPPDPSDRDLPTLFLGQSWPHRILTPPELAAVARRVLEEHALSEEELIAEEQADPRTVEQAEEEVRNA